MTDVKLIVVCATFVLVSAISSIAYYNIQRDKLMSNNIENGIVKGVDPIAIKCAYDSFPTMCAVYAATKAHDAPKIGK